MIEDQRYRSIHDRERIMAEFAPTSATPGRVARAYLGLPDDVTGLTIIDLASGASSLTEELRRNGARPHAVDRIYSRGEGAILAAANETVVSQLPGLSQAIGHLVSMEAAMTMA